MSPFRQQCGDEGKGLYVDKTGVANLVRDIIFLNKAGKAGGGVFNDGGAVTVKGSAITNNNAPTDPNFSGPFTDLGGNTIG